MCKKETLLSLTQMQCKRSGSRGRGPLAHSLTAMAELDARGDPLTQVGCEMAGIIEARPFRVWFAPTGGAGACPLPWLIILDTRYRGAGQVASPFEIAMVAHEALHIYQRRLREQPHCWPRGGFRPDAHTRWLFDSTNYMEVLSYLVGSVVEHELLTKKLPGGARQRAPQQVQLRLDALEEMIATLADADAENAIRYIVDQHCDLKVYRQNYFKEAKSAQKGGRIPTGGWDYWLAELGFTDLSIERIRTIALQGVKQAIAKEYIDKRVGVGQIDRLRRTYLNSGLMAGTGLLYVAARGLLSARSEILSTGASQFLPVVDWVAWGSMGALVRALAPLARADPALKGDPASSGARRLNYLYVGLASAVGLVVATLSRAQLALNLQVATIGLNFAAVSGLSLALIAFGTGYFHSLITRVVGRGVRAGWGGVQAGAAAAVSSWSSLMAGVRALRQQRSRRV